MSSFMIISPAFHSCCLCFLHVFSPDEQIWTRTSQIPLLQSQSFKKLFRLWLNSWLAYLSPCAVSQTARDSSTHFLQSKWLHCKKRLRNCLVFFSSLYWSSWQSVITEGEYQEHSGGVIGSISTPLWVITFPPDLLQIVMYFTLTAKMEFSLCRWWVTEVQLCQIPKSYHSLSKSGYAPIHQRSVSSRTMSPRVTQKECFRKSIWTGQAWYFTETLPACTTLLNQECCFSYYFFSDLG